MASGTIQKIFCVTGNLNKVRELGQILGNVEKIEICHANVDLPEYQGDPLEIAKLKCKSAVTQLRQPCFVEDCSLCFNAFGGLPGPYIKWFLDKIGPDGLPKLLAGFEDKSAYALCTIAFSSGSPEDEVKLFVGRTEGHIVIPAGSGGFGWDSCFQPDGYSETYAQLTAETKNAISHRSKAVQKFKEFLTFL